MQSRNKHRDLMLSATFVGLVCGLVLTHQQAYAAQTAPVSNQESQITTVAAPNNNLPKTAAVNQDYSVKNEDIANPAASGHVTPSTYSSPETTANSKQQPANSYATAAAPTPNTGAAVPVANGTAISTNLENNNSTDPATSSPSPDTGNSASTPVAASDNQTNGHSANKVASSVQPETNIIAQGTWGTSKWDYTQEGADYILHLYAGTLGIPGKDHGGGGYTWDAGIGSLNTAFQRQLTKIIIDPGVIANQNSRGLFSNLIKLKTIQGLENLDTSQVTNMSEMFESCESLTNLDLSNFDTSRVTDMSSMFFWTGLTNLDVSNFDTSQVTNMSYMFSVTRFTHLDVSNFDTSQVTNMSYMFGWDRFTNLDLSNFDTSQVTDMSWMFSFCSSLTNLDVSNFDTSRVTTMFNMFEYCGNLVSLDLSHWDTSQVTNMSEMFNQCEHLPNLDVSHFDTSRVTDMSRMFDACERLTNLDLSHWDTSRVTNMSWMFSGCTSLISLDLSGFNISWDTYVAAMLEVGNNLNHLVLGPKTKLFSWRGDGSNIPAVPAAGTKIPGTDKVVAAPYWVATSGYQQGQHYTSEELEQITGRDQITIYDWAS